MLTLMRVVGTSTFVWVDRRVATEDRRSEYRPESIDRRSPEQGDKSHD